MLRKRSAVSVRIASLVMAAVITISPLANAQNLPIDPTSPEVQDLLGKYMGGAGGAGGTTEQLSPLDRASGRQRNGDDQSQGYNQQIPRGPSLIEQDYRGRLRDMARGLPDKKRNDDKDRQDQPYPQPPLAQPGGLTTQQGQIYGQQTGLQQPGGVMANYGPQPDRTMKDIEQFGYNSFRQRAGTAAQVTGRVSDKYILGVGDQLVVSFMGPKPKNVSTRVDREGRVIVGDLKPIAAAGRTFGDFRADLEAATAQSMLGTEAFVSLADVRQISVSVVGEVGQPGARRMGGFATVMEALAQSGGVLKSGTLRRIVIQRGGKQIPVDLYNVLTGGGGQDVQLTDGDRILVPVIGPTIAVAGEVRRPGIYELRSGNADRDAVLQLAGGPIRPHGNIVLLNRIDNDGVQTVSTITASNAPMREGDILLVRLGTDSQSGNVTLAGHVSAPGSRSLKEARTLRGLIGGIDNLDLDPYLPFAILETTDARTRARIMKAVNLEDVLYGGHDVPLVDRDTLTVFSRDEIAFLNSDAVRQAILFPGYVTRPTNGDGEHKVCPAVAMVARIVDDTQSDRFANAVRALTQNSQVAAVAKEKIASDLSNSSTLIVAAQPRPGAADPTQPSPEFKEKDCPSVFRDHPETLVFALDHVVAVSGAVMRPGAYPAAEGTSVQSLAQVAGGIASNADLSGVEVATYDVHQTQGVGEIDRRMVDISKESPQAILVNPGSTVRFNVVRSDQERGVVLLAGEVNRPGVYPIKRGERLSELIARAGGLTPQAYAYGAVFTRESVKKAQEEGIKRAGREMNAALAAVALKPGVDGKSLGAAQGFVQALNNAEVIGRMVVEADPAVLARRPDLDTILEPGDRVTFPKRMNYVSVSGDVLNPGTLQFIPGKSARAYLQESGGFQKNADKKRIFVIYPNGTAEPARVSSWGSGKQITPGSTLVVPTNIKPFDTLSITRDITQILSQLALSAASIAVINR